MVVRVRERVSAKFDDPGVIFLFRVQYLAKFTDTFVVSIVSHYLDRRVCILYLAFDRGDFVSTMIDV